MIIYPIGKEKTLGSTDTLSASNINLFNDSTGSITVDIIDLDGNVVANITIGGGERITIIKPLDYGLSATDDIHAIPVIRTQ
jgi:hypothetical protein